MRMADLEVVLRAAEGTRHTDEHVQQRGCYVAVGDEGTVMHNVAPRLSGTPGGIRSEAPSLGQHTQAVLKDAGVSDQDIAAMAARGAIKCN